MKRHKYPNYDEREVVVYHEVGDHEFELTAIVGVEFIPREPDVGIMQSGWAGADLIKLCANEGAPFPLPKDENQKLEDHILEKAGEDANDEALEEEPDYPED